MIDWFRSWSKEIVIAIIITTIIEMILPDNTSKKYIKIVIGIFIMYVIVSPIINEFAGVDISKSLKVDNFIEVSSSNCNTNEISQDANSSIIKIYAQNLENDLKSKLKTKGYIAGEVSVKISNDDSYNIENINIKINEKISVSNEKEKKVHTIVDNIKSIKINIQNNNSQDNSKINDNDKNEIKEYIKDTYEVELNKINIS